MFPVLNSRDLERLGLARILVLVGVLVLGFNLRPAAVSIGPCAAEVTEHCSWDRSRLGS
jgi:cyanate permease